MSGDLILEVNGQDLRTAAYEHVAYTLKVTVLTRQALPGNAFPSSRHFPMDV